MITAKILKTLFGVVTILCICGLLMVASASDMPTGILGDKPAKRFYQQIIALTIGTITAFIVSRIDYHRYAKRWAGIFIYLGILGVLAMVFLPKPFGHEVNGSHRWIKFFGQTVQPSEFVKIGIVIFIATYFTHIKQNASHWIKGLIIPTVLMAPILGLIVLEPDYGTTMIVAMIFGVLLLVAGVGFKKCALLGMLGAVAIGALIASNPNRMDRLRMDQTDTNHQAKESETAFMLGGSSGVGYGQGLQKHLYVPEAHTDFIFSVVGEELGLVGTGTFLLFYLTFLACGIYIATHAPDKTGALIAFGITFAIGIQVAGNMCVVLHLVPTKGLALPFISYGGSNLIASLIGVGILYNVGKRTFIEEQMPRMNGNKPVRDF